MFAGFIQCSGVQDVFRTFWWGRTEAQGLRYVRSVGSKVHRVCDAFSAAHRRGRLEPRRSLRSRFAAGGCWSRTRRRASRCGTSSRSRRCCAPSGASGRTSATRRSWWTPPTATARWPARSSSCPSSPPPPAACCPRASCRVQGGCHRRCRSQRLGRKQVSTHAIPRQVVLSTIARSFGRGQ